MTLRLSEADTAALRQRAEVEGVSMHDVIQRAIRQYIERTSRRELVDDVLNAELPRYAEALSRLAR